MIGQTANDAVTEFASAVGAVNGPLRASVDVR